MDSDITITLLALGLIALACGALIAMFAAHAAPEGFEDDAGCHLSPRSSPHAEEV